MNTLHTLAKQNAKRALKGVWGSAIAIVLLTTAIGLLFTIAETVLGILLNIPGFWDVMDTPANFLDNLPNVAPAALALTGISSLLSFAVLVPLHTGVKNWYYYRTYGHSAEISSVFLFFESPRLLAKTLWLRLNTLVRCILWGVLFFAPSVVTLWFGVTMAGSISTSSDRILAIMGIILGVLLGLMGGILFWIFKNRYLLAPYLICDDKTLTARQAIKLSIRATRGNQTDLALFRLSFLGWYILCALALPILYVQPYVQTSIAIYSRYLLEVAGVTKAVKAYAETSQTAADTGTDPEAMEDFSVEDVDPDQVTFDTVELSPPAPAGPEPEPPTGEADLPPESAGEGTRLI